MSRKKTIQEVIDSLSEIWGNEYDYSLIVEYQNNKAPLPIICKKHGVFYQSYADHSKHHGCPQCANEKTGLRCRLTLQQFFEKASSVHSSKYDYSLIDKKSFNSTFKVPIICPEHGVFMQKPHDHLSGRGCYRCGKANMAKKQALTRDDIVSRCNKVFNSKYDYSLFTEYHSKKDIIRVICPKHGVWEVNVSNHLYRHSGCPRCKRSMGEEKIGRFLNKIGIEYMEQYKIGNEYLFCQNVVLFVDFYLPNKNLVIEYNGIQHYQESPFFNTRDFAQQQERDNAVRQYCKNHKIKLIEIPYTEYENIEQILNEKLKI